MIRYCPAAVLPSKRMFCAEDNEVMKKRFWLRMAEALLFLILTIGIVALLSEVLVRKESRNMLGGYLEEPENYDVLFFGDSMLVTAMVPMEMWEDYGIASYVRGSPQQLIWHSYYLMEETLRYETPKAFVFNVLSMKYGEPQSEAYNRLALDGMKWSQSKAASIQASMTEEEDFISYVFPLLRFHSRWSELKAEDFEYAF